MPTENTYIALPFDSPTSVNYPPPSRSQSPGAATIPEPKWRSAFSRARGIIDDNAGLLLIVASQVFLALVNVSVKMLHSIDPPVSTMQLIIVRMSITYACCLTYMLSAGVSDPFLGPKGVRTLLAFRGFSGFFAILGVYYSLQYLSLSDTTVLTFLAPLCTAISSSFLLKEKFSAREALAGIFSLLGVILIARPASLFGVNSQNRTVTEDMVDTVVAENNSSERLVAVGMALVSVVASTCNYICLRAIGKRAHPLHALSSYSVQCITVSTTYMISTKSPFIIPTRLDWLGLLMLIGFFGFIAQVLLTLGLQRETASRGTLAVYTQVIFATVLERIFFKPIPSMLSVCGTLIILASALYVILTKQTDSSAIVLNQPELEEGLLENGDAASEGFVLEEKRLAPGSSIELHSIRA